MSIECISLPEELYNEIRGKRFGNPVHNDPFILENKGTPVFVQPSWRAPSKPRGKCMIRIDGGDCVRDFGTVDYSASQEASWYELNTGT